jgi:hypothetical protein
LTKNEVAFIIQGYIIVKDFFKPEELNPVRDAIADLVEDLAQKLYKAGKIKGKLLFL